MSTVAAMIPVAAAIPPTAPVVAIAVSVAVVPAVVVTVMPAVLDMMMVVVHHLAVSLPRPCWATVSVLGRHDDRDIYDLLPPMRTPRRRMHHHGRGRHHDGGGTTVNTARHIRHHGADAAMTIDRDVDVHRPVHIARLREPGRTDREGPHQPGAGRREDRIDTHDVCSFHLFNARPHPGDDSAV